MGILETRTIDFENLIILGMNEGSLPKSNVVNSMIPVDLRRFENQLPTEEDRQAIFAHHFYRLIQRAKNVTMTYNSHSEGLGGGEQSRFITQLENELDFTKGHIWRRYTHSVENSSAKTVDVVYKTTTEVQLKLDNLLANGLSPSALNKLITCPLDFYYRYIVGLKEEGEIEENIESSTFGTKIHDVLEGIIRDNFFISDKGSALTVSALKAEKKLVKKRLTDAYLNGENGKNFTLDDLKFGQNKLSFDVSEQLILGFLNAQIKEVTESTDAIIPVGLELTDNFYADLEFSVNGKKKPLKIKGTADRIDKKGDLYRIVDYKSGKCDDKKVRITKAGGVKALFSTESKAYGRQLLMYALMFRQQFPNYKKFSAGIISMVNMSDWYQHVGYDDNDLELTEDIVNEFEQELIQVISEIYNEGYEFSHNPSAQYCEHCGN
jgi:ATP-dependent helicase/DNAse subunit B